MLQVNEIHQLRVFSGDGARGNVTGVVAAGHEVETSWMAEMSGRLGFPDTAFVHLPRLAPGRYRVSSFSPFEELQLCTQTLLATRAVLVATGLLDHAQDLIADVPAGPVLVRPAPEASGVDHVVLPVERVEIRAPRCPLPAPVRELSDDPRPLVVSTGRGRLYCHVPADRLDGLELTPPAVLAYCAAEQVRGICLTSLDPAEADAPARLRVFTTSLGGAEDVSTGGAALGLVGYWRQAGTPLPAGARRRVRQGRGGLNGTAELSVRHFADGAVGVGGRVERLVTGRLLPAA